MLNFNKLVEDSIISALKQNCPNYDVESFPADFENYQFTSPEGVLLVKFLQADFQEQNTIWEVNQECDIRFNIIAGYRGLSTYGEIHEPQQKLKNTIQGLEILGRKIRLVKEQFITEINTDLYCGLTCKISMWQEDSNLEE